MTWIQADAEAEARYRALDDLPAGPGAIAALLVALRDASWRVRRLASDRLGLLEPTPQTVQELVAMLGRRDDTGARNAAAAVLAQLGPDVLPAMVLLLGHADPDQRKFAADILGALKRPEAVSLLVVALEDGDANVRTAAAEALGRVGGTEARRALERLLTSNEVLLRVCALEGLASLKLPAPLPTLAPLLSDPLTRRSAWRLMGHVQHPTAALLTVRALAVREVRDAALLSIGAATGPLSSEMEAELRSMLRPVPDLVAWLSGALGSEDDELQRGALLVTQALGEPRLALAVAHSVRGGRDAELALKALLRLGLGGARSLLSSIEALADLPGEARAVAGDALVRLAEPSLCSDFVGLLASGDPELQELAARALGRTGAREAVAALVPCFDDDMLAVHASRSLVALAPAWPAEVAAALEPLLAVPLRPHVVRAWVEITGPAAHDVLKRALHDSNEALRAAAAESAPFVPADAGAVLAAALMDESALVRRAATRTLPRLLPVQAEPLLARALRDADPTVLALACAAAGELSHRDASDRLRELTRHVEASVALAALEALSLLGRVDDELLLRAAKHSHPELLKLAFNLGGDRLLLHEQATAALAHVRWDVRVAAARWLSAAGGRESLAPLEDAVSKETDLVARSLLAQAVATLSRRV